MRNIRLPEVGFESLDSRQGLIALGPPLVAAIAALDMKTSFKAGSRSAGGRSG